jgi:hypothetical protein
MNLNQFFFFFLLPVSMALYALYGSKKFKIEIFILSYVFAHSSSGLNLFGFSFSFEKVMCLIFLFLLIFKYRPNLYELKKIILTWGIFFVYSIIITFLNEKSENIILILFDFLQILILPIFLLNYLKKTNYSPTRIALGFYKVGFIVLVIQLVEIYFQQDFYQLTNLSDGFNNYIGSITRNDFIRASSLFSEVSVTSLYSLFGLLLGLNYLNRFLRVKAIFLFFTIVFLSSTRLGLAMFVVTILVFYFRIYKLKLISLIMFFAFIIFFSTDYLESILDIVSNFTRSGSEISFQDADKDSSLFQREKQTSYLYNNNNIIFGSGRSRLLDFINTTDDFYALDSRLIMQLIFHGIIGTTIYFIGILKLIKFKMKNKTTKNRYFRVQLILLVLPFMIFSSVAEIFYLISLILPFLFVEKNNLKFLRN